MVKSKNEKGATLIELVTLLIVIAIISACMIGAVIFLVQLFMYSPRQLDTQKIGQELTQAMLEGNQAARGIRYARAVIDASATQFSYTYGYPIPYNSSITANDQLSVRFRWDAGDKHIYRATSTDGGSTWSTETVIPYYIASSITIDGKDAPSVIFTYKKAGDADWISGVDAVSAIRRVIISIGIITATGNFGQFQGSSGITASVEIKGF